MADINIYNDLDKAWKSTCRILLGEEVGELKEYEPWLRYFFPAIGQRKSYKSGKDIILAMDYYPEDANFVSLDEAEEKEVKLNINKIKDLDSILESLSELWEYTGNKVLGNSSFVESADLVTDCQYANEVVGIQSTAHSFATYDFRRGKYIFGSGEGSDGEFLIGFLGGNDIKRCFCSSVIADSSDLYLSHNCYGCQELMFSFHQVSKRHRIGNLELPKDKYLELKPKLLGEIREELKKNKQFPSLYQLVPNNGPNINIDTHTAETDDRDIRPIEKAFSSVMKILFKKDLNDIIALHENFATS